MINIWTKYLSFLNAVITTIDVKKKMNDAEEIHDGWIPGEMMSDNEYHDHDWIRENM